MKKEIIDKIEKLSKENRFIGTYENSNYVTSLNGNNPIEAIKFFYNHYNSFLNILYDSKENNFYVPKRNKKPDVRGNINYTYYDLKDVLLFNMDDLTPPIKKLKPSNFDKQLNNGYIDRKGNFYKCGFECHIKLASELFLSNTIQKPENFNQYKPEEHIEQYNWIKISSDRILIVDKNKINNAQKKAIINFMKIVGDENYEINGQFINKLDFENYLNKL